MRGLAEEGRLGKSEMSAVAFGVLHMHIDVKQFFFSHCAYLTLVHLDADLPLTMLVL